ncbi:Aste57867_21315 [Aphanomyces stellatus]|uniref:Aste57867_21315 protein n=1 Tax=Aphanomyces stellatus TaxID=120398 RepID=A0A485LH93_9STRA|nr:hypothetical protein As57867_021246 [Aphanomyces stellatus]VFT97987.1 Aste57867_21315 [Aphanomyces stellatus]
MSGSTTTFVDATSALVTLLDNCTGDGRYAVEWTKIKEKGPALQLFKAVRPPQATPGFDLHGVLDTTATIAEMRAFFTPRLTSNFKAMMKLLHGADFVDGAVMSSSTIGTSSSSSSSSTGPPARDDDLFTSVTWCALKSPSLLAKDKSLSMHASVRVFNKPSAHTRTLVYVTTPTATPPPSFPHTYAPIQWTFGVVVEEMAPSSLRISCRCSGGDPSLLALATRVVWNTLKNLPHAMATLGHTKGKVLVSQSQWIKDEYRRECNQCRADFTTFRRRHHCRTCGEIVCSSCSSIHVAALARGPMKIRMCATCLDETTHSRHSVMTQGSSVDGRRSPPESDHSFSLMRLADTIGGAARDAIPDDDEMFADHGAYHRATIS